MSAVQELDGDGSELVVELEDAAVSGVGVDRQRRQLPQPGLRCRPGAARRPPSPNAALPAQTNGNAERLIRTLLDEWAYVRLYRSNAERLVALPRYVDSYNRRRPHTAIRGLVPAAAVNNVLKHHT